MGPQASNALATPKQLGVCPMWLTLQVTRSDRVCQQSHITAPQPCCRGRQHLLLATATYAAKISGTHPCCGLIGSSLVRQLSIAQKEQHPIHAQPQYQHSMHAAIPCLAARSWCHTCNMQEGDTQFAAYSRDSTQLCNCTASLPNCRSQTYRMY